MNTAGGGVSGDWVCVMSTSKGHTYVSGFPFLAKLQSYSLLSSTVDNIECDSYEHIIFFGALVKF